eukprot:4238188-Prymnesium_polylepis.3
MRSSLTPSVRICSSLRNCFSLMPSGILDWSDCATGHGWEWGVRVTDAGRDEGWGLRVRVAVVGVRVGVARVKVGVRVSVGVAVTVGLAIEGWVAWLEPGAHLVLDALVHLVELALLVLVGQPRHLPAGREGGRQQTVREQGAGRDS